MMKMLRNLIGIWLLMAGVAQAQNCPEYDQLIKEGNQFKQQRQYRQALKKYNAASICSPNRATTVAKYIDELFVAIEHEKDEAVIAKKKAETNIRQMADLMGKITESIQPEKTRGIIGFSSIEHNLYKILLPYHEYLFKNAATLDKPWETAVAHLHIGMALEDVNSLQSEQELTIAFNESKSAATSLLANKKPIPNELYRCLIDAAVYHAWDFMNKKEVLKAQAVLFAAKNLTQQESIEGRADLINAQAKLENALSRLFKEKKQEGESFNYQSKAVERVRQAVALDKTNLAYKSTLAVYLGNLSNTPDSLMKKEAKSVLSAEGCALAREVDNTEGSGVIALKTVMNCVVDESYTLVKQKKTEQASINLQQAVDRLDKITHLDPANTNYYLLRAYLTMRLGDIEMTKSNKALQLDYLKSTATNWLKAINGKVIIPEETWKLRYIYERMRSTAQNIENSVEYMNFFRKIAEAIESSASVYGNVPAIALIAADSYMQVGEYMQKNKQTSDTALVYLTKAIAFSTKAKLFDNIVTYDENAEWFGRAYSQRLLLNYERGNFDQVLADYEKINELVVPIYKKFPFDFYLHQHITGAAMRTGELMFKKGRYKEAQPILEYASTWGINTSTKYLAQMYREGKISGGIDEEKAKKLEKLAGMQSMKKFTIPCDFGGVKAPFDVYVRQLPQDTPYKGIDDQAEWLSNARGGIIPEEVKESFRKLQALAWKNEVSFPDLCVYALEAANEDKAKGKFKEYKKQIELAKDSTEKINFYKEMTVLYEDKIKTDSTKSLYNKDAAVAFMDYSKFLERNNKPEEANMQINRAYKLDSTNILIYIYSRELKLNHSKESITTLMEKSNFKELIAYMYVYLKRGNRKNADSIKNKIIAQDDTPFVRDQIDYFYGLFNYDIFKELFLSQPEKLTMYEEFFLKKDIKDKTNAAKEEYYQKLAKINETIYKDKPTSERKLLIAQQYNSVVWYGLLTKNFKAASVSLQRGLTFNPDQPYLLGNQPHILLFSGKVQEAKELYLKLKDKKFDEKAGFAFYKDAFLDDFATFEKLGITHPDLEEIKALLAY